MTVIPLFAESNKVCAEKVSGQVTQKAKSVTDPSGSY